MCIYITERGGLGQNLQHKQSAQSITDTDSKS